MHPQRSFGFVPAEQARFDNFEPGRNGELLSELVALAAPADSFRGLWLFGAAGLGKSHLLQATAHAATTAGLQFAYLPLSRAPDSEALAGLDGLDGVLLDDLDLVLGQESWERALMALYTGLFASGGRLILATECAPAGLDTVLPDLRSRLKALPAFAIESLCEQERIAVLKRRAARRGLPLSDEALRYWLRRGSRDFKRQLEDLELLLDDALGEQGPVTVNTVKRVLKL